MSRRQAGASSSAFVMAGVVFVVALLLRIPACFESLWVDELHTAWVVNAKLSEVASRAAIGNQTPWYFWGMWSGLQFVGIGELTLRLPSVLATSLASGLLVWCGWRATGTIACGTLAGMFSAVELNSIFYGTEARSYACVVFCVTLWLLTRIELVQATDVQKRWAWLLAVGFASAAGVLMHVTAAMVFVGLGLLAFGMPSMLKNSDLRPRGGVGGAASVVRLSGVASLMGVAVAGGFSLSSLSQVWQRREQWKSFATSDSFGDLLAMWPWSFMLLAPLVLWGVGKVAGPQLQKAMGAVVPQSSKIGCQISDQEPGMEECPELSMWFCVILVTFVVWILSYLDVIALWHRRYIVGLLPVVYLASAVSWDRALHAMRLGSSWRRVLGVIAVVLGLMLSQGQFQTMLAGDFRLVQRFEEWRGAVGYLQQQVKSEDSVWLASQLIESQWLENSAGENRDPEIEDRMRAYLLFPVRSIYRINDVEPLGPIESPSTEARIAEWVLGGGHDGEVLWILVRRARPGLASWKTRLHHSFPPFSSVEVELIPFRKLTVVRITRGSRALDTDAPS